jgi:hypothetical protein
VRRRYAEQHSGRSFGLAAALFPVLQGINADPQERRKLALAQIEVRAEGGNIRRLGGKQILAANDTGGLAAARFDLFHLRHAGYQLVEQVFAHGYSHSQ